MGEIDWLELQLPSVEKSKSTNHLAQSGNELCPVLIVTWPVDRKELNNSHKPVIQ
jgi:hypothetical protein